ncbi:MAG TPA: VWA domain-containing protein [Thermoanaerobaculia bacterium]|nr:VWA domain-containing protein [Thermoanaerobaculia bacterium]
MTSRPRALALALLAASLCAHPAPAQAPAPPQPPQGSEVFADSIDVNVVNIDVSVTDRKGKWVTGLTRDDFEVFEDGKPVEITYFYAAEAAAEARPEAPVPAVPAPERLQFAVYFDLESLPKQARPKVAAAVEEFLVSRASPQETVLLATYNGPDTLNVHELPASRPVLAAALQEIVQAGRLAPVSEQEQRLTAMTDNTIDLGGNEELDKAIYESNAAQAELDSIVASLMKRIQTRATLTALQGFVANFGSRPGRKALVFVSGGITFRPGQTIVQAFETKLGPSAREGPLSFLVRDVELAASSDRIAFYALGGSKSIYRPSISTRSNTPPPAPQIIDRSREIVDANPAASLAWIGEDLSSYYSLGYTPPERQPGRRHRVEVKVKRRGLHVRHIERYRERAPVEQARIRTAATLQMGGGENPVGMSVQMGQTGPEERGKVLVPVTLEIPLSKVALLPGEGGAQHGNLSILITARDSKGRIAAASDTELPLRFDGPPPPGVSYSFQLRLRSAPHKIVLGVWDEVGNTVSTVTSHYAPEARAGRPSP